MENGPLAELRLGSEEIVGLIIVVKTMRYSPLSLALLADVAD